MVLIRELLQYYPSERSNTDDTLSEPWITGKQPTPRQLLRPKYIVSCIYVIHKGKGIPRDT